MEIKKWKDVLRIVSGKNQSTVANPNGRYPIYGSGGLIGYANDYLCEPGTTIIGRKGTINKPIFVSEPFWNIDTAFGLVPGERLNKKYLYYFCQHFNFLPLDKSTGRPSLAKSDLLKIEMPIPPLSEQERIVSRIEELFSQLDAGVETLKKVKTQLGAYRQAVLKEAFSTFKEKKFVRELSTIVTSGSRGWAKYYSDNGARFIRISDLTRNGINLVNSNIQYVLLPDNVEGKRSRLQGGDVVVSITADLGSIALIPDDIQESYINQHIAMIRFKKPNQGRFMAWYLRSEWGQTDLLKNKRGGGKLGLGLDDIRDTPVPIVSDEESERTCSIIDSRLSLCTNIVQTVDTLLAQSVGIRRGILKRAFEGSL